MTNLILELGRLLRICLFCAPLFGQPVWTDVMNTVGTQTMASGVYWEYSNLDTNGYSAVAETSLASHSTFGVPRDGSGNPVSSGGDDPVCTSAPSYWTTSPPYYRFPQQRMESYVGTGIKGFGILGTFQAGSIGSFGSGSYLYESAYFHERGCYFGGREYGFFYDAYNGTAYAYWEVNANCGTSNCSAPSDRNCTGCTSTADVAHDVSVGNYANSQYYFEIYPTGNSSACAFQISVITPSFVTVYSQSIAVGSDITSVDPAFCGEVTSSSGATGYVTVGTVYGPTISSISTSTELLVSRAFVGK